MNVPKDSAPSARSILLLSAFSTQIAFRGNAIIHYPDVYNRREYTHFNRMKFVEEKSTKRKGKSTKTLR